jgi:simple sugar transport system ATP-binding protein
MEWLSQIQVAFKFLNLRQTMSSPKDAINLGIGMVHQHFMLAKNLTVLENIILGIDKPLLKNIKLSKYKSEIKKVMDLYSLNINLNQYVDELSVGRKATCRNNKSFI